MLPSGSTVIHPQWGKGTVLFDKPHCIGIRFLEYGQVNFSQEEWASQHSPSERFRSCINELEYALDRAVDAGELQEDVASEMLSRKAHMLEVRRRKTLGVDEAYERYKAGSLHEDDFYEALKRFAQALVRRNAPDDFTFSNIEDAISESLLEIWQRLKDFDSTRTNFKTFVTIIVRTNVQDALRLWKTSKGHFRHVELDENTLGASKELTAEKRLLFDEWLKSLDGTDRAIAKMLQDGLTQEEIGEALSMSHQAISKRLIRLRIDTQRPF